MAGHRRDRNGPAEASNPTDQAPWMRRATARLTFCSRNPQRVLCVKTLVELRQRKGVTYGSRMECGSRINRNWLAVRPRGRTIQEGRRRAGGACRSAPFFSPRRDAAFLRPGGRTPFLGPATAFFHAASAFFGAAHRRAGHQVGAAFLGSAAHRHTATRDTPYCTHGNAARSALGQNSASTEHDCVVRQVAGAVARRASHPAAPRSA
jgi:hypothetical protein